jgi:hypothetical protein
MPQEWITDRLPTEADGDMDGLVFMRHVSSPEYNFSAHWSHVGPDAPWQRTIYWKPPTEPDRIAALEQRVAELEAQIGRVPEAIVRGFQSMLQKALAQSEAQP